MYFPFLKISSDKEEMLSLQLICWGLVQFGVEPPDDFVEWLDEVSQITGAYTGTECMDLAEKIIFQKKLNGTNLTLGDL
jgi:hypothetical protein